MVFLQIYYTHIKNAKLKSQKEKIVKHTDDNMNYTNEELMMNEEAYLNDDCQECPCDEEIYDILHDACVDLEYGDAYELDNEAFRRVFKAHYKDFNTDEYFIIYDVQGEDDVALMKFKKE